MNGAAGALIKNSLGEILIVKPNYREGWLLPGGVIEPGESPKEACRRECKEELGLDVQVGELLCFEYRRATTVGGETTRFVFDCGTVLEEDFKLQKEELEAYKFTPLEDALGLVDVPTVRRLRFIQEGKHVYFES